jgi:hypothetical protein
MHFSKIVSLVWIHQTELRILQPQWMKSFEKVHPHSSPEMDSQANYCVQDGGDSRPNTHIPAQIKAGGIGPASQNIPGTKP